MSADFDPYEKWLGIPQNERPITCYRILGIPAFSSNPDLIADSVEKRIAYVEKKKAKYPEQAERVLKRLHEARDILLDPQKRHKYDAKLRQDRDSGKPAPTPPGGVPVAKAVKAAKPVAAPVARPVKPANGMPEFPNFEAAVSAPSKGRSTSSPAASTGKKPKKNQQALIMIGSLVGACLLLVGILVVVMTSDASPTTVADAGAAGEGAGAATAVAAAPADPNDPLARKLTPKPKVEETTAVAMATSVAPTTTAPLLDTPTGAAAGDGPPPPDADPPQFSEPDKIAWSVALDGPAGTNARLDATGLEFANAGFVPMALAVDPAAKVAVCGGNASVIAWDMPGKKVLGSWKVAGEKVLALALPSAEQLLIWSDRSGIRAVNPADGATVAPWPVPVSGVDAEACDPDRGIAISPGGKFAALVRKGIRFYKTESGELAGIVEVPAGQSVIGIGFAPLGDRLLVATQTDATQQTYRVGYVDLVTGESNLETASQRSGLLLDGNLRGLMHVIQGKNQEFLLLGNVYLLKRDDGRLASAITKQPPTVCWPTSTTDVWVFEAPQSRMAAFPMVRIERAARDFDRSGGAQVLGPGVGSELVVTASAVQLSTSEAAQKRVTEGLKQRFETDGLNVGTSGSSKITATYSEGPGPTIEEVNYIDANGVVQERKLAAPIKSCSPKIEMNMVNLDTGGKPFWWQTYLINPQDVVLTAAQAEMPIEAAYKEALLDLVAARLSGVRMPYFYADGINGSSLLPIEAPRLGAPAKSMEDE